MGKRYDKLDLYDSIEISRLHAAGVIVVGWDSHPLKNAALPRRTPI